ncbi:MAG: DUF3800 domain-containing protein [Bifidobacteriaceae bacterium]|jgi:hypothetical protein|nr:DUF3800 domain-containing protein [Bifidobacteriaceae bacterium]
MTTTTVYLDESGDLGFDFTKAKTSRHFLMTGFATLDPRAVQKAVKAVFRSMPKAQVKARHGVLHAVREDAATVRRLLTRLARLDGQVVVLRLNKQQAAASGADQHAIYIRLANLAVAELTNVATSEEAGAVRLVASRRETNRLLNEHFRADVAAAADARGLDPQVDILRPSADKGLQAADFLSWSFFHEFEHGDATFSSLVRSLDLRVVDVA